MEDLRPSEKQTFFDNLKKSREYAKTTAHRDYIREAHDRGAYGFYIGLARQTVECAEDGSIILSESSFARDGHFTAKYVVIDPITRTATAWAGQAVNNDDLTGRLWQLTDRELETTLEVVTGLNAEYPKSA